MVTHFFHGQTLLLQLSIESAKVSLWSSRARFLLVSAVFFQPTMPPKSKRARQSLQAWEKGREAQKKAKLEAEAGENVVECTQHEHTTASANESAATLERSGPSSESTISTA